MENTIKKEFENYIALQRRLSGLAGGSIPEGYTASDLAVIDLIGRSEGPTVTEIAETLGMTRGAISKITKKLLKEDLIESYLMPGNRQKIYFRLKKDGQLLFEEYTVLHDEAAANDDTFFEQYSEKKLHKIEKFMREYNEYLEKQLKKAKRK